MKPPKDTAELLQAWEAFAQSLASGYTCDLDDWRNDVDARRLLAEGPPLSSEQAQRLAAADKLVRAAVRPHDRCVWGRKNAQKHGWNADEHWYYFMVPNALGDVFAGDLKKLR
jgi:hypothetical protein